MGKSKGRCDLDTAVRNEARARRMMLREDDFWQFASTFASPDLKKFVNYFKSP